jgi:hypothetical protein
MYDASTTQNGGDGTPNLNGFHERPSSGYQYRI